MSLSLLVSVTVSPDGNLLQSSTVADSQFFCFSGDEVKVVPASYIEFAERLVLPEYAGLPPAEVKMCFLLHFMKL